jgi:hypothetical protein
MSSFRTPDAPLSTGPVNGRRSSYAFLYSQLALDLGKRTTQPANTFSMAKKKTFKNLIPNSFDYHVSKLWEGLEYPLFRMNLNTVHEFIEETKAELGKRFGAYDSRQGIGGELDSITFILQRLIQWDIDKSAIDKRDLYVYLEALQSHLKQLFEMFDEIDAE